MAEQTPDSIITTQRNGQTIVAELFFNHSSTETFRDKLLKLALANSSRLSAPEDVYKRQVRLLKEHLVQKQVEFDWKIHTLMFG